MAVLAQDDPRLSKPVFRGIRPWILWALLMLSAWPNLLAQPMTPRETQVKAIFLFNFAHFVKWPAAAFPDSQSNFVIGVLGNDPFGAYLDEAVRGEVVNQRPLVIQRFQKAEEIKSCHVLFISRSEAGRIHQILSDLKGRSVLTVGDFEGFAKHGGMVRFANEKGKTHLKINIEAVKAADLVISSKLLRPAEIIRTGGE
jgi:YfiR/HmsC-like